MTSLPELRKDPLLGRWILVPRGGWPRADGKTCLVCERLGELGEALRGAVALPAPVLDRKSAVDRSRDGELHTRMSGAGEHELLIETRVHGTSLADLSAAEVQAALALYRERLLYLRQDNRFRHMAIVKNCGPLAGALADHAHAEAFALPLVPPSVKEKILAIQGYHRRTGTCVFCDMVRHERTEKTRRISESMRHIAIAPWASHSPFEMLLLPKGHHADFADSEEGDLADLAALLLEVLARLDRVVEDASYTMIVQTAPPDMGADLQNFHWHIEIHPKLALPSPLAGVLDVNLVPPEDAARMLREAVI
jgi:UDPglucose--hexose-1-phosphate uridylyltransferase